MTKTHWKKLNNPDYLGAYSLDKNGKYEDLVVTIDSVKNEEIVGADGKKEVCIVARMKGQKPMILNATNCKTLTKLFKSPHIEDWCGKQITLFVSQVKAFGDFHDALRIRPVLPAAPAATGPDLSKLKDDLQRCTTLEELRKFWEGLTPNEKNIKELIELKDKLKTTLP